MNYCYDAVPILEFTYVKDVIPLGTDSRYSCYHFRYNFVNIAGHVYIGNRLNIKTKGAENSAPFGSDCYI